MASPTYACQLVLVTKLVAVLNAEIRRDVARAEVLRIEGQHPLRALQQVGQQEAEDAEAEQRRRVLRPALLDVFLDADHFVGEHFQPPQHRMHERALPFEDLRHVGAQRLRADQDQPEEQRDLQILQRLSYFPLRTSPDEAERKSGTQTALATRFRQ